MLRFPSRFRRLDEILADLPLEYPLLLTELDGYLAAIAVCPEEITPGEWLPPIWGGSFGEEPPFEDPIDAQLFADMVEARYKEIVRDLGRGKLQPIFDIDERTGDVLWEEWVGGFSMGMELRLPAWSALADGPDTEAAAALADVLTLVDIASDESSLTSVEINTICDQAISLIMQKVGKLYELRVRRMGTPVDPAARPVKIGRNDPCSCGSGKKYKRCCGAD